MSFRTMEIHGNSSKKMLWRESAKEVMWKKLLKWFTFDWRKVIKPNNYVKIFPAFRIPNAGLKLPAFLSNVGITSKFHDKSLISVMFRLTEFCPVINPLQNIEYSYWLASLFIRHLPKTKKLSVNMKPNPALINPTFIISRILAISCFSTGSIDQWYYLLNINSVIQA